NTCSSSPSFNTFTLISGPLPRSNPLPASSLALLLISPSLSSSPIPLRSSTSNPYRSHSSITCHGSPPSSSILVLSASCLLTTSLPPRPSASRPTPPSTLTAAGQL